MKVNISLTKTVKISDDYKVLLRTEEEFRTMSYLQRLGYKLIVERLMADIAKQLEIDTDDISAIYSFNGDIAIYEY